MTVDFVKARDLTLAAIDAGWSVLYKPQVDSGQSPFVTVEASTEGKYFSVTWHTRQTGTPRLFHCEMGADKRRTQPVSLRTIREAMTA